MNQRKKFWQGIIHDEDEINNLIYSDKLKQKIFNTIHNLEAGEYLVGTDLKLIKNTDPKLYRAKVDWQMRMLLTPVVRNGKPYFRYLGLTPHNYNIPLITDHPGSVIQILDSENSQKIEDKYFKKLEEKQKKEGEKAEIKKIKSYPINYLPVEFYDNKWIILNDKQKELLNLIAKNGLPLLLTGAPGAGKTMLGLMFTAQATDASEVSFFSPTDELLDEVEKQFENSECSKILTAQEKAKIGFKNAKILLSKYFSPGNIKDEKHCQDWIDQYLDAKKKLGLDIPTKDVIKIFSEFRNISGFTYPTQDKEAYINNNDRLSLFPREYRRFLWKAYRKYIKHLDANGWAHVDFTPLPIDPDNDEIIIIDECQLLSLLRIKNLCERARGRVFIAINPDQNCGEDNVSKLEFIKSTLKEQLKKQLINKKITVHELPCTYRLPQNVLDGANCLLKLIRFIDEGTTAQGQQNEIFGMHCETDIPGTINWFNPSQISLEDLKKLTASSNCAVVTLPEFVDTAKRELGTDNVFTADEIIGLQFPIIIGYKFFSGALYHKMLKEVSNLISDVAPETILQGVDIHRTKERDKKSNAFWSMLYILWTRVGESLVFYDDIPTSLVNENTRKQENDLFHLYKFLIEQTATKEQIDFNNPKMDESKSNEAWLALIKKYISQGRFDLAKNNFLNRLKGKLDEFEKLKAQYMPKSMKATELVSKDKDKNKDEDKDKGKVAAVPGDSKDDKNQKQKQNNEQNQKKTQRTLAFETNFQNPAFEAAKQAATEGDVISVKKYLNNKISLHTMKELLYAALKSGHIKVVELLLEHDQSLMNMPIKDNKTPLSIAVEEGRSTVVQFLLAFGADPNGNKADSHKKSKTKSKIKIEKPIEIAIEKLDLLTVDRLLAHGETLNNDLIDILLKKVRSQDRNLRKIKNQRHARNKAIAETLNRAVENGCTNIVKICLALGWEQTLNDLELQKYMLNWIKEATQKGYAKVLKLLLSFESTKNALDSFINTKMNDNKTPICLAAERGHLEVVRLLLNKGVKADPNNQESPLFLAASNGYVEVVKLLLAHGANPNFYDTYTALTIAVLNDRDDVVKVLLSHAQIDPNILIDDMHVLHIAVENGNATILQMLLAHPGIKRDIKNKDKLTPLGYAKKLNRADLIYLFENINPNSSKEQHLSHEEITLPHEWGAEHYVSDLLVAGDALSFINSDYYELLSDKKLLKLFFLKPFEIELDEDETVTITIFESIFNDPIKKMNFVDTCLMCDQLNNPFLFKLFPINLSTLFRDPEELAQIKNCQNTILSWVLTNSIDPMSVIVAPALIAGNVPIINCLLKYDVFHPDEPIPLSILIDPILSPCELPLVQGVTPLMIAANNGHLDIVKCFLKYNVNINAESDGGFSALYLAVEKGHIDVIRCLINAGANPNAKNDNVSLLELASEKGDKAIISLLKEYVSENEKKESQHQKEEEESPKQNEQHGEVPPPLSLNTEPKETISLKKEAIEETNPPKNEAIEETDPPKQETIEEAAPKKTEAIEETDPPKNEAIEETDLFIDQIKLIQAKIAEREQKTQTLLNKIKDLFTLAIETGSVENIEDCLSDSAAYLMNETYSGMTPIIFATTKGHPKVVEVLIKNRKEKKEDEFFIAAQKGELLSALFIAVKNNNLPLVNLLLNYVKPNGDSVKEITTFSIAAKNGNVGIIKAMIKSGLSLKTAKEALFYALKEGNIRVVEILLQSEILKNIINMPLKDNKTPLYIAAENNKSELVNFLLRFGADPDTSQINDALTEIIKPIDIAAKNQNFDIVNMLLKYKSTLDRESMNNLSLNLKLLNKDALKNTNFLEIAQAQNDLIEKAAENGHEHILRICLNSSKAGFKSDTKVDDIKIFILNLINKAAKNGHAINVEMLLTFKYADTPKLKLIKQAVIDDINTQTNAETAMHFAVDKGHMGVVKVLVAHGVKGEPKRHNICMPIYMAAQNGNADLVKYLLEQGANPNTATTTIWNNKKYFYTPLGIAMVKNHPAVVEILLSQNGIILDDTVGIKKRSYFHIAANTAMNKGDDTLLKMLLNDPRIDRNIPDMDGLTACEELKNKKRDDLLKLFDTTKRCAEDTVHVPPQANDSLNDESTTDNEVEKFTPDECADEEKMQSVLIKALLNGNCAIVKILLALEVFDPDETLSLSILMNEDPHHEWEAQTTPLMLAAGKGQLEMLNLLLAFKADSTIKSEEGTRVFNLEPLIFTATCYHHFPIVKMLLEMGVDPNITKENGQSLLFLAIEENQPDIVAELLSRIKEQQLPDFDIIPFLTAIDKNSIELVNVFINHYLKYNIAIQNKKLYEEDQPLIYAVLHANAEIVDILLQHNIVGCFNQALTIAVREHKDIEIVKVFLKSGGVTKELAEETCIHAANIKNDQAATLCLNYLKEKFKQQTTLLHLAVKFGGDALVKTLIKQAGANLNVKDTEGNTPLHLAVQTGNFEIVKMLLDHSEVKLNKQNNNQQTPFDLAIARKDEIGNQIMTYFQQKEKWKDKPKGQSLGLHRSSQGSNQTKKKTTASVPKKNSPANSVPGSKNDK